MPTKISGTRVTHKDTGAYESAPARPRPRESQAEAKAIRRPGQPKRPA